jgi:hypothetical protein
MVVSYAKYLIRRTVTRGMTKTRVETALHEWGELFFTGVQYLDSLRQGVDVGVAVQKSISSYSQRPADIKWEVLYSPVPVMTTGGCDVPSHDKHVYTFGYSEPNVETGGVSFGSNLITLLVFNFVFRVIFRSHSCASSCTKNLAYGSSEMF